MIGLFGRDKREEQQQPVTIIQQPQGRQKREDILEKISSEIVIKGAPQEPILRNFMEYPQVVFPEFLKLTKMVIHPAVLLGFNSYSDVADILNELELLGLEYKCRPAGVRSDKYNRYMLLMNLMRGDLNLSVNGRLLQAVTRFIFPEFLRREEKPYYREVIE